MTDTVIWPILAYAGAVGVLLFIMLGMSALLGGRHTARQTGEIYESGIPVTDDARKRIPAHFSMVAMFFLIFDLEVVFIVAWAISFRETGWTGYAGLGVFILTLVVVLVYEWRNGALDYALSGRKIRRRMEEGVHIRAAVRSDIPHRANEGNSVAADNQLTGKNHEDGGDGTHGSASAGAGGASSPKERGTQQ